jgi:hypothetical protein
VSSLHNPVSTFLLIHNIFQITHQLLNPVGVGLFQPQPGQYDPSQNVTETFMYATVFWNLLQELKYHSSEWGMACVYGARAYNSSDLLNFAEYIWGEAVSYQVSVSDAASGKHSMRSVPFNSTCSGSKRASEFVMCTSHVSPRQRSRRRVLDGEQDSITIR